MRQGVGCLLCETRPGSLDELRRCLEGWRFVCAVTSAPELAAAGATELLVVELQAGSPVPAAAELAARRRAGAATLALCAEGDGWALSLAASLACDDILTVPLDPVELVRRLQVLHSLAELGAERRLRAELFASYRDPGEAIPVDRPAARPNVVLLGPPGAGQVGLAAALPPAQVTYIDHPRRLGALLHAGSMDVLLLTDPALLGATLDAIERADREPPVMLAAHAGAPFALELPPQVDLLSLPAPPPAIRRRLELTLRLAALRQWLRDPPLGAARTLIVDSLTGLYNQGAFLDYLRHTGGDRVVIGLEHDRLEWTNQRDGYAAGNRILARLGGSLRRKVRAQDLAAHLGGGRLAVAVGAAGQAKIDRLRSRLQATIAGGEPWTIIACAEPRPGNGPPAQRLARLFGDLGRLRRAA